MNRKDVWRRVSLVRGDITRQRADAVVNAANAHLAGGGGVDGAIHRAAGPGLLEACSKLGGCPTGSAKITPGFDLPAKYVIHAVGPRYRDGRHGEADDLASCYRVALRLAAEHHCETVAFSAISCGIYGYPLEEAAHISIDTATRVLAEQARPDQVVWVLFDDRTYDVFSSVLADLKAG